MPVLAPLYSGADLLRFQRVVRAVPIAEEVARYAVRLAGATRPRRAGIDNSGTLRGSQTPRDGAPAAKLPAPHALDFVSEWVRWGAGLRAAQFLVLGAKARALLAGRFHVAPEDIQALALPVLRHRVLLGYRAEAEGITVDTVVRRLLEAVPAL